MKFINRSTELIKYWWFRYTMVTELYIVERWESAIFRKSTHPHAIYESSKLTRINFVLYRCPSIPDILLGVVCEYQPCCTFRLENERFVIRETILRNGFRTFLILLYAVIPANARLYLWMDIWVFRLTISIYRMTICTKKVLWSCMLLLKHIVNKVNSDFTHLLEKACRFNEIIKIECSVNKT